jgi:hypothetical protein
MTRPLLLSCALLCFGHATFAEKSPERVTPIKPPAKPFPTEAESANITKFGFIVYGDTRGRRDGSQEQYEHSLVMDSMLSEIKKSAKTEFPIRFVLQTGDAVVDGKDTRQWNNSFVTIINRLTQQAGIYYFLAPGNHDVTSAREITSTNRLRGLSHYLEAVSLLIPDERHMQRLPGYPCYSFGYGNSFFLGIDSNIAGETNQFNWAEGQLDGLDRKRYPNVFAFFHHPPFSSGPHGGGKTEEAASEVRKKFMPLFRKHDVKAILTGHEHLFEHWVERYERDGKGFRIDEIVTGGGGAPLVGFRGDPEISNYLKQGEKEKVALERLVRPGLKPSDNPYHFVIARVDGEHLSFEVVGVDWGRGFKPYTSNQTSR